MWIFAAAVLVLLLAAAAISIPLVMQRLEPYVRADVPEEPFSERDALLDALSDLEESYRAGKLSEPDYTQQRDRLQRRYVAAVEADEQAR